MPPLTFRSENGNARADQIMMYTSRPRREQSIAALRQLIGVKEKGGEEEIIWNLG
jgi:hypothetical protein